MSGRKALSSGDAFLPAFIQSDPSLSVRHIFLAFTNPVAGQETAFNEWYDSRHVPEVLRYGRGLIGCQRLKLHDELESGALAPWQYLALYDLRCDDLTGFAERPWALESPPLTPFRGLVEDDHVGWVFTPRDSVDSELASPERTPPFQLLFAWSTSTLTDRSMISRAVETNCCTAAHVYGLAHPQRRAQLESPWQGLVIYELARSHAIPCLTGFDAAWRFTPVSRYIARSEV